MRGLGDVEFLPVTQQKRLALTVRQAGDLGLDRRQDLRPGDAVLGALCRGGAGGGLQGLQEVEVLVGIAGFEVREVADDGVADLLAPEPVHRGVGQDALEQQRQFRGGAVGVLVGQPDHAESYLIGCTFPIYGLPYWSTLTYVRKFTPPWVTSKVVVEGLDT